MEHSAANILSKVMENASLTDAELEQLQLHVDELELKRGFDSVHHHEDQNVE